MIAGITLSCPEIGLHINKPAWPVGRNSGRYSECYNATI